MPFFDLTAKVQPESFLGRLFRVRPKGIILGFTHDMVGNNGDDRDYLERWILWHPFGTLRLHKFHDGDDDSAPHDHPWWFITFPLQEYVEHVEITEEEFVLHPRWQDYTDASIVSEIDDSSGTRWLIVRRLVRPFRLHWRAATFRHMVQKPRGPVYTLVVTGGYGRKWGFWPKPDQFVYWRDWVKQANANYHSGEA